MIQGMDPPRSLRATLLAGLLAAHLGCYHYEKPRYELSEIEFRGSEIELILAKTFERVHAIPWSDEQELRHDYYLTSLQSDGDSTRLNRAQFLGSDRYGQDSDFVRTPDGHWLQVTCKASRVCRVRSLSAPGRPGTSIASFRTGSAGQLFDVMAITRAGQFMLSIDDNHVVLSNLHDASIIEDSTDHPLLRVREKYFQHLGGAGDWFLTDDLRYVVASPPDWKYFNGGMGTPESTPVRLFGIDVDLAVEGLIYDRKTSGFSKFGKDVNITPPTDQRLVLADAESVGGELLLRYGVRSHDPSTDVLITNRSGNVVGYRRLKPQIGDWMWPADVVWVPKQNKIAIVIGGQSVAGNPNFATEWYIHIYDYRSDAIETLRIDTDEIREAIPRSR